MISQPSDGEPMELSQQDAMQLQSMVFDLASKNAKATFFGLMQAVAKFMVEEGVHPKNIDIAIETGFKLSRKSMIQVAKIVPEDLQDQGRLRGDAGR